MMEAIKKIELPKLSSRAVLGSLTIGVWGGERVDDKQTSRVIKSNNAAQNSARVIKRLVDRKNPQYAALCSAADALRVYHKASGMTWDGKARILISTDNVIGYLETMAKLKKSFDKTVRAIIESIEDIKAENKPRLGTMFNEADYPTEDAIKSACYAEFYIEPVPEKGDFRIDLDNEFLSEAADKFEAQVRKMYAEGLKREAGDLLEEMRALAENLGKEGKAGMIKETMVERTIKMAQKLMNLNVMKDRDLDFICKEVVKLGKIDIETMRNDPKVRAKTGRELGEQTNKLKSAMKYF